MKYTLLIFVSIVLGSQAVPNSRIVGGFPITINDAPYQVSISAETNNGQHFCGGSIISRRWILTAAHCTINFEASELKIRIGSSFHATGGKQVAVKKYVNHPLYLSESFDYDYALIELKEDIELSDKVQIIALVEKDVEVQTGTPCMVSGWGLTKNELESRDKLRAVVVPIVDRKVCEMEYQSLVTDRMICAGVPEGGKNSCSMDSGGPLVRHNGNKMEQVGIVSWGTIDCKVAGYSGVYANVAIMRDWIKEVSGV
ncbi:trypsin 5G1-like [Culicoides brevitarsis]|uniref:trypsin 5G1-like n=1 Tax=Culicoides brevitarsis TaxID=469753 RepID=UPI00307B9BA3